MRLIDGDVLVMLLTDWWYASFGQTETQESKAIKAVLDQVKIHVEKHECKPCEVGTQMSLPSCEDAISRQAAIDAIDREMVLFKPESAEELHREARRRIMALPSAQPEIIRCKDCKWKNEHNCTRAVEVFIDDDKYCAWAERR